jgi:hypothetical protein
MNKIIYPNQNGGIIILTTTGELPFEEVCRKDVPANTPYIIVDESLIPTDREFRDAWEMDFSNPDGFGADYGQGTNLVVKGYDSAGKPILKVE